MVLCGIAWNGLTDGVFGIEVVGGQLWETRTESERGERRGKATQDEMAKEGGMRRVTRETAWGSGRNEVYGRGRRV